MPKLKKLLPRKRICPARRHARRLAGESRMPGRRGARADRMRAVRVPKRDKRLGRRHAKAGRMPGNPGARAGVGLADAGPWSALGPRLPLNTAFVRA